MKVVVAIDSFKGCMTSLEAGTFIKEAIEETCDAKVQVFPLADGGEGTVEALMTCMHGEEIPVTVTGPLGEKVESYYGILAEKKLAVMEMANVAGITMVPEKSKNPMNTTTYGVGEMILDAIEKGCREFIVGIGGSATNDGGAGMLAALGYRFIDRDGDDIHRNDTMQEIISLSERFGIHITFSKPNKQTFLNIVHHLAKEHGIDMPTDELDLLAERFALERGGRSARLAKQFIDRMLAK